MNDYDWSRIHSGNPIHKISLDCFPVSSSTCPFFHLLNRPQILLPVSTEICASNKFQNNLFEFRWATRSVETTRDINIVQSQFTRRLPTLFGTQFLSRILSSELVSTSFKERIDVSIAHNREESCILIAFPESSKGSIFSSILIFVSIWLGITG